MAIEGVLNIPNEDYGTTVSAVDVNLNGSQIGVVYIDGSGNLKAGSMSCVQNADGTLTPVMTGCTVV
jgi:hypothetical protein